MKLLKVADSINLTKKQIKAKAGIIYPICATTKAVNRILREPIRRRAKRIGKLVYIDT